ncbi:MAG: shikimate dehydrogenase [Burkholderiaceae bacterium]
MTVDHYAVIGNPIAQSKSPLIHAAFAQAHAQALEYGRLLAEPDTFESTVRGFIATGGRGMNVTAPFKLQAFGLADDLSERARQAGAVNALSFEGGRILADNFDGVGLVADIQRNLGVALRGKRVLLLGAGGATRGALLPLLEQGPAQVAIANRDRSRAAQLVAELHPRGQVITGGYPDFAKQTFDVVVNATSASLRGELPPLASQIFAPGCLAYELAYGKGLTPFLRVARDAGAGRLADGVGMLVEQAAEAFAWWRGVRPDTRVVIDRLTVPLE